MKGTLRKGAEAESPSVRQEEETGKREQTEDIHEAVKNYLFKRYDFRFNVLTGQVEQRPIVAGMAPMDFLPVDHRILNTMVIELRKNGVNCWDKDVERVLQSNYVENFHPFYDYMAQLPQWDGRDRVTALALRVDEDPIWLNGFRRWLLALTAQWMGLHNRCANTLTPLLVSLQQGLSKSTFCRLLMPPELEAYYLDKFDLNAKANLELKLAQFGLINLDEFDRYSTTGMATLKNLVQLKRLTVKRAYSSFFMQLGRIASFIGTSNQMELLNDPSGSRRFLCVEVKHPIDCSPIDHAQLFAQLKQAVGNGERIWMDAEEEKQLQEHNHRFDRLHPEQEVFYSLFRIPELGEKAEMMTATEIHRTLCLANPSAMRGINVLHLGRSLSAMGLKRIHTKVGNKYRVIRKNR